MRKERLTERNEEICNMYHRGASFKQIAERYGLHSMTVKKIVFNNTRVLCPEYLTRTEDMVFRLARLGVYAGEIAEALNLPLQKVVEAIASIKRKTRSTSCTQQL